MSGFFYGMRFEAPEKEVRLQAKGGREYGGQLKADERQCDWVKRKSTLWVATSIMSIFSVPFYIENRLYIKGGFLVLLFNDEFLFVTDI